MENNFIKENFKEELLKKNKNLIEKNKNLIEKNDDFLNEIIILKKDIKKLESENLQLIEKFIINNVHTYVNSGTQTDFIEIINDEKELGKMISSKSCGSISTLKKSDDSDEPTEMIYSSSESSTDSSDE